MNEINLKDKTHKEKHQNTHLPALTGVRFFAIFYIFLHHLWAIYNHHSGKTEATQDLLIGLKDFPETLLVIMSNGWISTSLFFILSGFILAYMYWGEDGQFTISKRRFWLLRFARLYPVHLLVLLILIAFKFPTYLDENVPIELVVSSAIGSSLLIQAWVPAWIPMWSWPTWTISVMIFLYLIMPYIITVLSRLSRRQLIITLMAMPILSILPAVVFAIMMALGITWNMNTELFFNNFPLFWVPYFVAGILITRIFSLNKFSKIQQTSSLLAWGDFAFIIVIVIACTPDIMQPMQLFIRQGLLMPLYIVFILDLACGKGIMAKMFTLPGTQFLGETGFSIFIWQSVIMTAVFVSLEYFPEIGPYQFWLAIILLLAVSIPSTYLFEKPLARLIRIKYIDIK
jgi:peptidoglycan/LPS O-acetylase OafA/YrhL